MDAATEAAAYRTLERQCLAMQIAGIASVEGAPLHQHHVELIGGPADGTRVPIPEGNELLPRFHAQGAYDDGTGRERVEYVTRKTIPCFEATPVRVAVYAGLPGAAPSL